MALVDVLAPTDFILNSPLGQADGQVNALAPPHSHCCPTIFDLVDFVGFLRYCEMKCPDFGQVSAISQRATCMWRGTRLDLCPLSALQLYKNLWSTLLQGDGALQRPSWWKDFCADKPAVGSLRAKL